MATIHHQVGIMAPLATVYEALANPDRIGTWWDAQTPVQTDRGLVLEHNPGPAHGVVRLRVVERALNEKVEWECISTHPSTSPASAWTGTRFVFDLTDDGADSFWSVLAGDQSPVTILDFRQIGYDERSRFHGFNNFAWGQVLANLKRVLESLRK